MLRPLPPAEDGEARAEATHRARAGALMVIEGFALLRGLCKGLGG